MQKPQGCKIYVVSLLRASHRREAISRQMTSLGLEFSFIDAIDAKQIDSKELFSQVDEAAVIRMRGHMLRAPEVGCALSHRKVYEDIVNSGSFGAIVLEDDVKLSQDIFSILEYIGLNGEVLGKELAVYHLGALSMRSGRYLMLRKGARKYIGKNLQLAELIHSISPPAWGTYGYYITRTAAKSLISRSKIDNVADCWSDWAKYTGGKIFICIPPVVIHPDNNYESDIFSKRIYKSELKKKGVIYSIIFPVYYGIRARVLRYIVKPFAERFF
jgi:glycosyl transferase family 25